MFKKIKEQYILLMPPAFWLLLFFVVPMLIVIGYSFSSGGDSLSLLKGFSLENYKNVFQDLYFRIFLKSFWYALVTTIITLLIAFPIAYYMSFASPRAKIIISFLIILPFWTNFLIRMYSIMILLGDTGLINTALIQSGIIDEPLRMMNNTFGVYVGFVYWNLPFMILPIFSSLDRMEVSLLEASLDLGANKRHTFFNITLPYAIPGLVSGIIFTFIPTLGNFVIPEFLGNANNSMIGNVITSQYLQARNWPFGSALSTLLIFIMMIFISLYIRFFDPAKSRNITSF
jgi:spermidine/putrescine transport system permease protein